MFLPLSCPVLLSLGLYLTLLAGRAAREASQPRRDLLLYQSVCSNRALSSKATNNRTIAWYSAARFQPAIYGRRRSSASNCGGVFFPHPAKTHGLTFDLKPTRHVTRCCYYYSYKCKVNTRRGSFLSSPCRHKAVPGICRPQTWQEQHAAAQTGHPAHHDHEQDVIHRCQVGESRYLVRFVRICFL